MTSVERTAYPRFGRLVTARELVELAPTPDEVTWARERTRSDAHLLALIVLLKCFQRLGRFPGQDEVPEVVVDHVRRSLGLSQAMQLVIGSQRTAKAQRGLVREHVGVVFDPERARTVAAEAIRAAAAVKNNPPDLINVALELLVKESVELPGFSTLDRMASRIRSEVNAAIFARIVGRVTLAERAGVEALLGVEGPGRKSGFNRLKQTAGRASWSAFREQVGHLGWVDSLGDAGRWLDGVVESKVADFAGEAAAADAAPDQLSPHLPSLRLRIA